MEILQPSGYVQIVILTIPEQFFSPFINRKFSVDNKLISFLSQTDSSAFSVSLNDNTDNIGNPVATSSPIPVATKINKRINRQTSLRVLNINFRSCKTKVAQIENLITSSEPDIIIGNETWLNKDVKSSEIFPSSLFEDVFHTNTINVNIDFDDKSRNISCDNSLWIHIHEISVREESMSCKNMNCELNKRDSNAIRNSCNGKRKCNLDWNFNTKCIKEYGYFNISYICKAMCDFEDDTCQFKSRGWERVNSIEIPTQQNTNTTMINDHTTGNGFFMTIRSVSSSNGEFKSIKFKNGGDNCLTFWYLIFGDVQLYVKNIRGNVEFISSAQNGDWLYKTIDIFMEREDFIIFQTLFLTEIRSGVALDDVSLSSGKCKNVMPINQSCISADEDYTLRGCPSFFLSELNINLTYNVSGIDQVCHNSTQIKEEIDSYCNRSDWKPCKFKLTDLSVNGEDKCFQLDKKLSIVFSCTDTPMLPITSIAATQQTDGML
ncbi:unnamed protein product [Mytilus coruscus]|uniref:MAM domain-containing protein n=1 Tax=Mytilus coruscus TaxID=42192 RepID=A0A6J7ZUD1_MYTCO|nr:unnamed protein product [Mytilus coruscus]